MRFFVVGGAGFIGSHLVDVLVERGDHVTILDDFSVGKTEFLEGAMSSGRVRVIRGDARELEVVKAALTSDHDVVFNLAANPEARHGLKNTRLDLELGTI